MTAAMQNKVLTQKSEGCAPQAVRHERQGGVGKSSVTVNLATALASRGFTVGVLDVDIHGPSVPRLLGASASVMADENGKMLPVPCGERMSLISMDSFLKDKDTAILWRGPKKTGAIRQFLTDVQWGALDYLVIDSPPGTGDEHLTVLDAIPDAGCIVVTTPQEISRRYQSARFPPVQAPVLGIVENIERVELFGTAGRKSICSRRAVGEQPLRSNMSFRSLAPFRWIPLRSSLRIGACRLSPLTEKLPGAPGVHGPLRTPLSPRPRPNRDFPQPDIKLQGGQGRSCQPDPPVFILP